MFRIYLYFSLLSSLALNIAASHICMDPAIDPQNIKRPCPDFNVDCIRNYFTTHSKCQLALGPVQDPLFLKHYTLDFPNSNVTFEDFDVNIYNMDGDIVEFYINIETRKLVLALEVHNLTLRTPKSEMKCYMKGREPVSRIDSVEFNYGTVTFTAVFPTLMYLNLSRADVFSYVEESQPKYKMGSNFDTITDPQAKRQYEKLMTSLPIVLREAFSLQGRVFMENYIQDNICDFGLDLSTDKVIRMNEKRSQ